MSSSVGGHGQVLCPLCGDTVADNISEHVLSSHSSAYCFKCKICTLRQEDRDTKCDGCNEVIEVRVKEEVVATESRPASAPFRLVPISVVRVVPSNAITLSTNVLTTPSETPSPRLQAVSVQGSQQYPFSKQPVQCQYCRQWFNNKDSNLIHKVLVHGLCYCRFCDNVFSSEEERRKHISDRHSLFSCSQCKQNFSSHILLYKHRAERHKLFACNFCDYNFTQADFQAHHEKTHRMAPGTIGSFSPDEYFDIKTTAISSSREKMKLKCLLCDKPLKMNKMINHIKYHHNYSNWALLDCFNSASMELQLNSEDGGLAVLDQADPSAAGANNSQFIVEVTGCGNPNQEYNCYMCNAVYADCGAHLLFQHNLRRCRDAWCEKYFLSDEARRQHEARCHQQEYKCSVCSVRVTSQYKLVTHRWVRHNMQTCFFCDSIILTALEPFANHLTNHHFIKNHLTDNARTSPAILKLVNTPLLKFCPQTKKVDCGLCGEMKKNSFDCHNGGEEMVRHLVDFHRIKNPSRSLFNLFTGTQFHYHNLTNDPSDVVTDRSGSGVSVSAGPNLMLVQRVLPRNILEQALASGAKQIKIVNTIKNQCILCKQQFASSEDVQRHLLSEHVTTSANKVTQDNSKADIEKDPLAIKQEDAEQDAYHDDGGVEIDEEHFSINNVEVKITEEDNEGHDAPNTNEEPGEEIVIKDELEYDENDVATVDFPESLDQEEETLMEHSEQESPSKTASGKKEAKTPINLTCEVCGKTLPSILHFTTHMKKFHKDSDQERNKPFSCDICQQGFYFRSSLNSHKSKAHQETSGTTFRCPLCPSVTNSKNGMRRHLRNSHKKTLLNEELSYKCGVCGELFWSIHERTVHISQSHKSGNLSKCNICDHISPNRHALRRHFQRMHPNEPLEEVSEYKCDQCEQVFTGKSLLVNHMKTEHSPTTNMYQCTSCPSQFTNKKSLSRHVLQHKKQEPQPAENTKYPCEVCHREFDSRKALKTHHSTAHNEKSKKGFVCKVCNKVLDSANDRSLHYKIDHPEANPYLCSFCGQGFLTKNSLYNHRMCHKTSKVHICPHCNKEFNRRDSFNEHLLIHVGPRHKCTHCPKEFVQKSNLKRHLRIHLGIKPYKCQFCDMMFSDKGACNSHQRTHTGEEREACPICHIVFSKKQKLKYHMRIHTGEGLETCHICNKVFTHTYALNVHMKIHSKENNFMCHQCQQVFPSAKDLYKHILNYSNKTFQCSQCTKTFKYSKMLNKHVLAFHQGVEGLKCSFEQCNVSKKTYAEIREHVREAHSVRNPSVGNHFSDEYAVKPAIDNKLFDESEPDIAAIYSVLDEQIDEDVLKSEMDTIKEETPDPSFTPTTTKLPRSSLPTKARKTSISSPTGASRPGTSPTKRKRKVSSDKLVVKIRNKKEKIGAADEEEDADDHEHEIKSEPEDN